MIFAVLFAATIIYSSGGVTISGDRQVDPAQKLYITVTPKGMDLRSHFRGFRVAEDYDDEKSTRWELTPEPWAKSYKIASFDYGGKTHESVYFDPPNPRGPVEGGMEDGNPKHKRNLREYLPKIVGFVLLAAAICGLVFFCFRHLVRRVHEHFMSPIERARVELDRLVRSSLPAKGKFKDFYVELTMVVRRYIQRKYSIKAPHLTTEEFLALVSSENGTACPSPEQLKDFLESADMVKFAGVAATVEMSENATKSAREYLEGDNAKEAE